MHLGNVYSTDAYLTTIIYSYEHPTEKEIMIMFWDGLNPDFQRTESSELSVRHQNIPDGSEKGNIWLCIIWNAKKDYFRNWHCLCFNRTVL